MLRRRTLRDALRAMDEAQTFLEWEHAAMGVDALLELDAWRNEDESPHYDARLIRAQIRLMAQRREANDPHGLFTLLQESLYRHLNELAEPELYDTAWAGTKNIVTEFLDASADAIDWLANVEHPGVPLPVKLQLFQRTAHVYGRSALMLSGGATLGFHHLGAVKALFEQDLLPSVMSGASMGAMIAAGICSRTDDELRELFSDIDEVARDGLALVGWRDAVRGRHLLEPKRLERTILHNCGDWTFMEAFARSGRVLNISVSPIRRRQKPRVLCHLTSPDVLISSAALASSAVPGLFPAVQLQQRSHNGIVRAYASTERWIDGTMRGDLPTFRVGRLHNVNHFVVSQTNPHVLPFLSNGQQKGFGGWARELVSRAAHRQGVNIVTMARELGQRTPLGPALDVAESLAAQSYRGDIDIFPPVPLRDFTKVIANPTREDLRRFVRNGERGAWPRIAMVRAQTKIGRTLEQALGRLEARSAQPPRPRAVARG